jgi:hypothetical protein
MAIRDRGSTFSFHLLFLDELPEFPRNVGIGARVRIDHCEISFGAQPGWERAIGVFMPLLVPRIESAHLCGLELAGQPEMLLTHRHE